MKPRRVVEVDAGIYAGLQVFHCFIAVAVQRGKSSLSTQTQMVFKYVQYGSGCTKCHLTKNANVQI